MPILIPLRSSEWIERKQRLMWLSLSGILDFTSTSITKLERIMIPTKKTSAELGQIIFLEKKIFMHSFNDQIINIEIY